MTVAPRLSEAPEGLGAPPMAPGLHRKYDERGQLWESDDIVVLQGRIGRENLRWRSLLELLAAGPHPAESALP